MGVFLIMGRPGAGKSFYAIKKYALPAIAKGRRVVHNLPGFAGEKLGMPPIEEEQNKPYELCVPERPRLPPAEEGGGGGVFVHNSSLLNFPQVELDDSGDTIFRGGLARGGDLWIFDEMGLVMQRADKDSRRARLPLVLVFNDFLAAHRHYTGGGYSFDLVLIAQHDKQLPRGVFETIQETVIMRASLVPGMFRAIKFEGAVTLRGASPGESISDNTIRADKKIFSQYHSFAGGEEGKITKTGFPFRLFLFPLFLICLAVGVNIYNYDTISGFWDTGGGVVESPPNRDIIQEHKRGSVCAIYWDGLCRLRR